MKITLEIDFPDWSEVDHPRSPGLHLTDIIKDMDKQLHPTNYRSDLSESDLALYGQVGFLWEQTLSRVMGKISREKAAGTIIRPGEVMKDGIAMSPDGIDVSRWELHEYKARWASSAGEIPWKWLVQIKGYCLGVNTKICKLVVLYMCGNWKPPVPQYKCYRLKFTELELIENWEMILNHARSKGWLQ